MKWLSLALLGLLAAVKPEALAAQVTGDTVYQPPPPLYVSKKDSLRFEIGRIEILGNDEFTDDMLLQYVSSRPTASGVVEDLIVMYLTMAVENGSLGQTYEDYLFQTYDKLEIDFGYYSENSAEIDTQSIEQFYQMEGYHEARVRHYFIPDTAEEENVLVFYVEEGPQYTLDTVVYTNIGLLDSTIKQKIADVRNLSKGIDYKEQVVLEEIIAVKEVLMNNGYYSVFFDVPDVIRDSVGKTDSVWVNMRFGDRVRFGEITYKHQLNSQLKISNKLVGDLLEFKEGEYYSKRAVDNSEGNLLSLQTFEVLNIDTLQNTNSEPVDTILPFLVYMSYKPQTELGMDLGLVEKEEGIEFLNLRGQISFEDINILGGAQTFGASVIGDIRDINRYINSNFSSDAFEWEGQLNFLNYYQPILYKLGQTRIGMNIVGNYSSRNASQFNVNTLGLGVKFPVDFADRFWIDNLFLEVYLEKQSPESRETIIGDPNALFNFEYFEQAQDFNSENPFLPTALVFSSSVSHDTRNDLFDPTSGIQFNAQLAATPPFALTQYVRTQVNTTGYLDIGWGSVLAGKLRLGHIFFYGDQNNNYISTSRQFFAGGPNSNRGWDPRRLRYNVFSADEQDLTDREFNFFQDFVGNATLVESSLEYRYRFKAINSLPPEYSSVLKDLGVVVFADIGNSFGWLIDRDVSNYKFTIGDIIENLAVATGFGVRYFTPFGPVRIDLALPIYGPLEQDRQLISEVEGPLGYLQFNLGLQHAF